MTTYHFDISACQIEYGFITHADAVKLGFELRGNVALVTGSLPDALEWAARINAVQMDAQQIAAWLAAQNAATVAAKIERLWAAADAYTSGYISGVAIGLLTIGVLQSKPKALAVSAWSSAVWDDYYTRKALVTVSSVDNLDFSIHGPMPHSVPELRGELGI